MSQKRSKLYYILGGIAVLLFVGYYILFLFAPSGNEGAFTIKLEELRSRAGSTEEGAENLPVSLNGLIIGEGQFPSAAIMAGQSLFQKTGLVFVSYQLNYADGSQIIIDTAQDESLHNEFYEGQPFYSEHFAIMQEAMKKARLIVATHEHVDHVGGIAQSPFLAEIKDQVRLTPEQINGPTIAAARFPDGWLAGLQPLEYEGVYRLAPGIALQKAPGHSVGSQLVYIRLQNGKEYLFVGDIAWDMANIDQQKGRPALVSWVFLQENRQQVADQLVALHRFKEEHPEVRIIVAHDKADLEKLAEQGIGESFQ
ncbi:MAG: hypothetical protein KDK23_11945 [Leptospiraceae bacterium]|nr:hypothetical protein [Leptospiraceae bacterium]